jgi:membrane associated rhomboid family serine protease
MLPRTVNAPFILALVVLNTTLYGGLWLVGQEDPRVVQIAIAAFALWPSPNFILWQVVTYAFLHGGFSHLLLNMLGLWMFGKEIERHWGTVRTAAFYFICVLGGAIGQLIVTTFEGTRAPMIGASGGVFGILLAFGVMFPERRIIMLIPPMPVKAKWVVLGYGLVELWLGVSGTLAGIAHFAHLGGMVFGALLILAWPTLRRGRASDPYE